MRRQSLPRWRYVRGCRCRDCAGYRDLSRLIGRLPA